MLAIVLPIVILVAILGITLFVRYRIRVGREEDMELHMENAKEYISYENYSAAAEEYRQAKELANTLKQEQKQQEIGDSLLMAEQVLLAEEAMENGEMRRHSRV